MATEKYIWTESSEKILLESIINYRKKHKDKALSYLYRPLSNRLDVSMTDLRVKIFVEGYQKMNLEELEEVYRIDFIEPELRRQAREEYNRKQWLESCKQTGLKKKSEVEELWITGNLNVGDEIKVSGYHGIEEFTTIGRVVKEYPRYYLIDTGKYKTTVLK